MEMKASNQKDGRWAAVRIIACTATALAIAACQPSGDGSSPSRRAIEADQQGFVPSKPGSAAAGALLSSLRARFSHTLAPEARGPLASSLAERGARVVLPARADLPFRVEDQATGTAIEVSLSGARAVDADSADGYAIYRGAHDSGATVLHRILPVGNEDFLSFEQAPKSPEVAYRVRLVHGVSGLRLVANTLEMIDEGGAPRLRVAPPYIVGADGERTDAVLAVEGCAVMRDASPPWDHPVTSPGAAACTVRVSWPGEKVRYPALLDPTWTTTGSMTVARQEHTALLLSTGKVLVAGGRSNSGTTGLATAELYDRTTGTWAATGSMTGGRRLHSMTQLNTGSNPTTSGKVLVAGGIDGTISRNTAQLYNPTTGTWAAAGNLNAARHLHTSTLLPSGRVLVSGGMNGTTTLQTAAVYNPASGAGSWSATTGPIPPPGWRFGTATLIQTTNAQLNNRVLLAGGNNGTSTLSSVFLYDPAQNAFSTLASMPSAREQHTAVVLPNTNGKLLVMGGKNGSAVLATAVVFDPGFSNGSWSTVANMTAARQAHTATLLTNGQVLVAGGSNGTASLASAELFNGTSWAATAAMPAAVQGHIATRLSNGIVLIAGGVSGSTTQSAARLYDVTGGTACTSNSQCAAGFCVSGVCCNTACTGQCSSCTLPGSVGICAPRPNGTACEDGDTCTRQDACQAGACVAGPRSCVAPIATCVTDLDAQGTPSAPRQTVALFGYDSAPATDVTIDVGASNQFVPGGDRGQPRVFHPGRHPEEVAVSFSENGLAWQLDGSTAVAHPDLLPCTATQVDHVRALRQAQRAVQIMRTIADPAQRQFVSAVALNALSSMNRAIAGSRANDIEKRIGDYLGGLDPASRAFAERTGRGLPLIPPEVRAELLGPMGNFDPGDGSNPSDWDTLLGPTMSNINPRLRTNFCELPTNDVTSGMFDADSANPDDHEVVATALALPVVKGLQRSTVVTPHPALIADHDANRAFGPGPEGDGFFAGGVRVETLQCPCDGTQGLICSAALRGEAPNSTDRCVAFPIIRQGADFTLRGHNFWDAESAGIVLNPVGGGNGVVATLFAHESGVDTNGTDRDCLDSDGKTNITHDSLTFRTSAPAGFYRMRVFNQNGKYRLRQESPMAPGRTVHVCWRLNGQTFPPEPTTNLSCAENGVAGTTCPADGAGCPASAWTVAPRALDAACQHAFTQPIRCGETPAWIGSEADPRFQPIVAVQTGDTNFELRVFRQAVEAVEESGWDSFGEDETQIFLAAFSDKDSANGINSLDELKQQAGSLGPDDYDTGTRRVFSPTLPPNANHIRRGESSSGRTTPSPSECKFLKSTVSPASSPPSAWLARPWEPASATSGAPWPARSSAAAARPPCSPSLP